MPDISPALRKAVMGLVHTVGAQVLDAWQSRDYQVDMKGAIDPVTSADLASEAALRSGLQAIDPGFPFLGEEAYAGEDIGDTWVIDPIDGTVNFATGHPMFAVNVARFERGQPVFAVTFAPAMGETYWAAEGEGAWLNGARLAVQPATELLQSVGATGFPYWLDSRPDDENNLAAFSALLRKSRAVRRGGCAALDLGYVAAGRFAFYWEPGLKPWDLGAGALLVREAGGVVSGYDGQPMRDWFSPILACVPELQQQLVQILTPFDVLDDPNSRP